MMIPLLRSALVSGMLSFSYSFGTHKHPADDLYLFATKLLPFPNEQLPPQRIGRDSFPYQLINADNGEYDRYCLTTGEELTFLANVDQERMFRLFPGTVVKKIRFCHVTPNPSTNQRNDHKLDKKGQAIETNTFDESAIVKEFQRIVMSIYNAASTQEITLLYKEANKLGLFQPLLSPLAEQGVMVGSGWYGYYRYGPYPVLVTLVPTPETEMEVGITCLIKHLRAYANDIEDEECKPCFLPSHDAQNKTHRALVVSQDDKHFELCVLMHISFSDEVYDLPEDMLEWKAFPYDEVVRRHEKHTHVEGVAVIDDFFPQPFRDALLTQINDLAQVQEREARVDYHPNSKDVVRDLVHPGLYSYVKDVTVIQMQGEAQDASIQSQNTKPAHDENIDSSQDEASIEQHDFWGRPYETSHYQWLPTYFNVSKDGKCVIEDYINNLVPREQFSDLYGSLSKLFEEALPHIESVYSYVQGVRPSFFTDQDELVGDIEHFVVNPMSLRGIQVQVITKIVDYELNPGQSYEGVWHVEGMSHEEIVLTCLYILDRDETLVGGDIHFKRAYLKDEALSFFREVPQNRHPRLEEIFMEGLIPLGCVETPRGRLIVFPNSHVHRVSSMFNALQDDGGVCKRRIVVFFLVNLMKRIVSTREVAPQQKYAGGSMELDDALAHRLALMKERKYHKQDWNIREVELCEH